MKNVYPIWFFFKWALPKALSPLSCEADLVIHIQQGDQKTLVIGYLIQYCSMENEKKN